MKKNIGDFSTEIYLTIKEAKNICKLTQDEKCCAFLTLGINGFKCIRMSYPNSALIFSRLEKGTMNAKGKGEWLGCPWNNTEESK